MQNPEFERLAKAFSEAVEPALKGLLLEMARLFEPEQPEQPEPAELEVARLRKEISDLREALANRKKMHDEHKVRLRDAVRNMDRLVQENHHMRSDIEQYKKKLEQVDKVVARLTRSNTERLYTIEEQRKEISEIRHDLRQRIVQAQDLAQGKERQAKELAELKSQNGYNVCSALRRELSEERNKLQEIASVVKTSQRGRTQMVEDVLRIIEKQKS